MEQEQVKSWQKSDNELVISSISDVNRVLEANFEAGDYSEVIFEFSEFPINEQFSKKIRRCLNIIKSVTVLHLYFGNCCLDKNIANEIFSGISEVKGSQIKKIALDFSENNLDHNDLIVLIHSISTHSSSIRWLSIEYDYNKLDNTKLPLEFPVCPKLVNFSLSLLSTNLGAQPMAEKSILLNLEGCKSSKLSLSISLTLEEKTNPTLLLESLFLIKNTQFKVFLESEEIDDNTRECLKNAVKKYRDQGGIVALKVG